MQEELRDPSPMPKGCHKGKRMQDVPASYLFWYWTHCDKKSDVGRYIERNIMALELEYPDGIWREK